MAEDVRIPQGSVQVADQHRPELNDLLGAVVEDQPDGAGADKLERLDG